MLALSIAEGFARTHFRFHPACSHASSRPLLSRLFPLHTTAPLAIPLFPLLTQKQGVAPPKKCRRADICSLFSPIPPSWISFLSITCALFHFPYHTYPLSFQHLPHSFPKNGGYSPLRSYQCFRRSLSFVKKPLLCVPSQRTLRLCGESLFSLLSTRHFLPLPFTSLP